jgi:H+-transporting ATPase
LFMTDFVKISFSTDNVRWSRKPNKWNIAGLVKVAAILGLIWVAEAFGLLYIGLYFFNLIADDQALNMFCFELLLFFALFSILVVRERAHFWNSLPSRTLLTAIVLDMVVGILIATFGIPGLKPVPLTVTSLVIGYTFLFSLIINDLIKYVLVEKHELGW